MAIVDDNRDIIEIYEQMLKNLGHKKDFVGHDGDEVVEAIVTRHEVSPDVIIMDYKMPNMNGLEAAVKIQEFDKSIQIILATGDASVIERAVEIGLQAVLKPFTISKLKELLETTA